MGDFIRLQNVFSKFQSYKIERSIFLLALICLFFQSCTSEVKINDSSSLSPAESVGNLAAVIQTTSPSGSVLSGSNASIDFDDTPTIVVNGVSNGDQVKLYTDASCTTEIGSFTSSGSTVEVTTNPLGVGSYDFYVTVQGVGATISACSSTGINYTRQNFLEFTQEPVDTAAAGTMPSIKVSAKTDASTVDTSYTGPITLSFEHNPSEGGSVIGGTLTVNAVSGVASFDDISINIADNNYSFMATASNHISTTSSAFTIMSSVTILYRSVGAGSTAALASGTSNALTMTVLGPGSGLATFQNSLALNIGVGDVVVYDSAGAGTNAVSSYAFIKRRISDTQYILQSASGATPTTTVGDLDWQIFRAYTSLSDAVNQIENVSVNALFPNFDNDLDLVTRNITWNICLYADALDTASVTIDGWATDATHYLRVYTPTSKFEVGTSQRHNGVWGSGYKLYPAIGSGIDIRDEYVRVHGLQVEVNGSSAMQVQWNSLGVAVEIQLSHNIVKGNGAANSWGIYLDEDGVFKVWNNVAFDFTGTDSAGISTTNGPFYLYNNTAYGNNFGFWLDYNDYAKNNISVNNTGLDYKFAASCLATKCFNNLASDATAQGTNPINNSSVFFVDTNNGDFNLAVGDVNAVGAGLDLSGDAFLKFTTDITGKTRSAPWDLGAHAKN